MFFLEIKSKNYINGFSKSIHFSISVTLNNILLIIIYTFQMLIILHYFNSTTLFMRERHLYTHTTNEKAEPHQGRESCLKSHGEYYNSN